MPKIHFAFPPLVKMNLRRFDGNPNTNVTTDAALSGEMKTYYSDYLIDNAQPELVHDRFAQKRDIPKGRGKTIEFRKYDPLPKALTPLTEGVTPDGKKLKMGTVEATVAQYGDYVTISDVLDLTAIDNNIVEATKVLGAQSGVTLDTVTREVLNSGTNVQYAEGQVTARNQLEGGLATGNHYLTVEAIRLAVRSLKVQHAKKFGKYYVAIIHPDSAHDLRSDPAWKDPHKYVDTTELYDGEIGMVEGCRFVETTEAKKFVGTGKGGRDVYSTLVFGEDAYGVTAVEGGGLRHFVKQLGSGGTTDPIDQRSTVGWKGLKTAERLVEQFMVRIESTSTFNDHTAN